MDPILLGLIGSLITIGGGVIGAILNYYAQKIQASQADELNKELRDRSKKIEELTQRNEEARYGGNGYCWVQVETFGRKSFLFRLFNVGDYTLEDVDVTVSDQIKWSYYVDKYRGLDIEIFDAIAKDAHTKYHINSIPGKKDAVIHPYPIPNEEYNVLGFGFSAKNGRWYQTSYIYHPGPNIWIVAYRVVKYVDNKQIILKEEMPSNFPKDRLNKDSQGNIIW